MIPVNASDTRDGPGRPPPVDRWVRSPLAALSFWGAVALPVLYVPLLAGGLDGSGSVAAFFGLVAVHVLSLVGGRTHGRRDA